MKHEVIDNSIDKEGHSSAFLPWGMGGVHRLSFVFQLSPSPMSQPSDLPTSQGFTLHKKVSIQSYETKNQSFTQKIIQH